ncbi:MAG TPA: hypothetical protein VFT22_25985 [Kofleriaceae bacterium]|nr:hypothetical protein [Kofleriaceae bacterium]
MSRRRKKQGKSFQQRQAERKQRERQGEQELDEIVGNMAATYTCSTETARDFADRCSDRLEDQEYEIDCTRTAIDFWSEAAAHAAPLLDALRELAAEQERHDAVIADLQRRMTELANNEAIHHHLDQPPTHYQNQLRLRLFTAPEQRPVQNPAVSADH